MPFPTGILIASLDLSIFHLFTNGPISRDGRGFMQAEGRKFDWLTLSTLLLSFFTGSIPIGTLHTIPLYLSYQLFYLVSSDLSLQIYTLHLMNLANNTMRHE